MTNVAKVLDYDDGGQVVELPAPATVPPLKRSYEMSGEGPNSHILIDGHKVFIKELTRQEFYQEQEKSQHIAAQSDRLQQDAKSATSVKTGLAARSCQIADEQAEQYAEIVRRFVKAWELPAESGGRLPCSPAAKADLPVSVLCEMAMKILQKSKTGQAEVGF